MNYLFDTNILIHFIRKSSLGEKLVEELDPFGNQNFALISIVSWGEILSLSYQCGWGEKKRKNLSDLLNQFLIIPVDAKDIAESYAKIDAYSQGKLDNSSPIGFTSRNMGKNDIWIAATAYITKSTLITTDSDFDHLTPEWIKVIRLKAG